LAINARTPIILTAIFRNASVLSARFLGDGPAARGGQPAVAKHNNQFAENKVLEQSIVPF
jgi:hypothetical protein